MAQSNILYIDELTTPIGSLTLLVHGKKAVRIDFGKIVDVKSKVENWVKRYFKNYTIVRDSERTNELKSELKDYFLGKKDFTIDYELYGTPFQKKVWHALTSFIPYGTTKSYQDVAILVNNPLAARAIGGAVNKNPLPIIVPCHRVVGANGQLVGFGGGLKTKEFLLCLEKNKMKLNE